MATMTFPRDSGDCIERMWADRVLVGLPNWKLFWEQYVGSIPQRPVGKRMYGLRSTDPKRPVPPHAIEAYENLGSLHYQVFVNVVGCHFQEGQLQDALRHPGHDEAHFRHWEAFDCFFHHLGACRNALYALFKEIHFLSSGSRGNLSLKKYLERHDQALEKQLDRLERDTQNIRDVVEHHFRVPFVVCGGRYYVPREFGQARPRPPSWSQQLRQSSTGFISTEARVHQGLTSTKAVTNSGYEHLHKLLFTALSALQLEVAR